MRILLDTNSIIALLNENREVINMRLENNEETKPIKLADQWIK